MMMLAGHANKQYYGVYPDYADPSFLHGWVMNQRPLCYRVSEISFSTLALCYLCLYLPLRPTIHSFAFSLLYNSNDHLLVGVY